jgi:lipoyl-dependent peroxiredoxin
MAIERTANAVWQGDLLSGGGTVSASSSGVFTDLPVTWAARTESPGGLTSPEELIAAAHASCYAMACSHALAGAGHPPQRLAVTATVRFDPKVGGGFEVSESKLTVRGQIAGLDQARFAELAHQGEQGCPVSNALRGNVQIHLEAILEG